MTEGLVLVVDDNEQSRALARDVLNSDGFRVLLAENSEQCLRLAREHLPDVIVLDWVMPGASGVEVAASIRRDPQLKQSKILMLSAKAAAEDRVDALGLGADDYLSKPYNRQELVARVRIHARTKQAEDALQCAYAEVERKVEERTAELKASNEQLRIEVREREQAQQQLRAALSEVERLKDRLEAENTYLQEEIKTEHRFGDIVSGSGPFSDVLRRIGQVAPTNATVLILGESGTGKELVARAVHEASPRKDRPLVKVNCAVLPANLIESELFGHEKGAFTGAISRKIGRFELAHGGTIFLDEIGDLPIELQAKLLRVLQEGEMERLGNSRPIAVDARVIAATNQDLDRAVEEKGFREDLFYRLNVFPITCPPLRSRREDIPALAQHFVAKHGARLGKLIDRIPKLVIDALQRYDWPGNVRELENIIERAIILSRGPALELEEPLQQKRSSTAKPAARTTLVEIEQASLRAALEACRWVIEGEHGAARRLAMKPSTLRSRMHKLGIEKP